MGNTVCDSIDSVELTQQACQLKWNPVVLYMSLLVHMYITVQFHFLKGVALRIPGPERCCTGCYGTYITVSLF